MSIIEPTIHIMKLCVGCESLTQLRQWEAARGAISTIHTKNAPTRKAELIMSGSLYWVIKGVIVCRRKIVSIEPHQGENGPQYLIGLDTTHFETEAQPRRAFQGWRYLKPDDAPRDVDHTSEVDLPDHMVRALKLEGLW